MANDNNQVFGMDVTNDLPEGCVPLEAVVLVKMLDEDGKPDIFMTATPGLTTWEGLGLVAAAQFRMNAGMNGLLDDDDYEDEGDDDDGVN